MAIQYKGAALDLDALLSRFPERVLHFDHVPMIIAKVSDQEHRMLEASSDIVDLRTIPDDQLRLVDGIDWVLRWAVPAMTSYHMNGDPRARGGPFGTVHAYPGLNRAGDELIAWREDVVLPTPLGWLAALNLSVGRGYGRELDAGDPVNVATAAAARVAPIVMAAGRERLSQWAVADWVIAVGATADEDGSTLAESSPAGADLVAWARSGVEPYKEGTSFAAARVSRELVSITAFALLVDRAASIARGRPDAGVPPVTLGVVDSGFAKEVLEYLLRNHFPLNALPLDGILTSGVAEALSLLDDEGAQCDTTANPKRLRRLLECSARPGDPDLQGWGCGFVSHVTTETYMRGFSGADLAAAYAPHAIVNDTQRHRLESIRLTDDGILGRCIEVWQRTANHRTFDYLRAPEPYERRRKPTREQ